MNAPAARNEVRPTRLDPSPARIERVAATSVRRLAVRPGEMLFRMATRRVSASLGSDA